MAKRNKKPVTKKKGRFTRSIEFKLGSESGFDEKWVQDRIAEDPTILGLGDIELRDRERIQPKGGRLDLLLTSSDLTRRYEVELQLGKTDESHIVRTIEYWDIERKRYPNYDHVAVIIAEDITSRFLNVINLLNGSIPLIALQMKAVRVGEHTSLIFSRVVDELERGLETEDEMEITDRAYWEKRSNRINVAMADEFLDWIHDFAPNLALKYNKFYIGLAEDGRPNNFVIFRPRKDGIQVEIRLEQSKAHDSKFERAKVPLLDYDSHWGRYRLKLTKSDLRRHKRNLIAALKEAFGVSS